MAFKCIGKTGELVFSGRSLQNAGVTLWAVGLMLASSTWHHFCAGHGLLLL